MHPHFQSAFGTAATNSNSNNITISSIMHITNMHYAMYKIMFLNIIISRSFSNGYDFDNNELRIFVIQNTLLQLHSISM